MIQWHVSLSAPKHYITIQLTLLGMHHYSHVLPLLQTITPIHLTAKHASLPTCPIT